MDATRGAVLRVGDATHHASDADYADEVLAAVASLVPHDGYCLFGVDPVSGLRGFMLSRNGTDGVAARLAHNETVERDANRFVDLAADPVPAGVLGDSCGSRSPRLHEILRPAGFGSELRMSLRSGTTMWGGLTLFRARDSRPFTNDDAARAVRLNAALSASVRARPLRRLHRRPGGPEAGVVLLDRTNNVLSMSRDARDWLDDLCAGGRDEMNVEDMLRVVYDAANTARSHPEPAPLCRTRTASGRWLTVRGTLSDAGPTEVAVVLQPATVDQLLPAVAAWLGLTPREHEVVRGVAWGLSARELAGELRASVLTVNTHLRSIYRKAGVTGREELLGRLR